jgi:hypothetical protein
MTGAEIIAQFEQYVDDLTELSTTQELILLNKIYHKICDLRPWEFLKKEKTGTMTTTTTVAFPDDFSHLLENFNYTDNSISTEINSKPCVVFISSNGGSTYNPFRVVNWSDRRQYVNTNGVCYIDYAASVITFPYAQSSGALYNFDYKSVPTNLTTGTSPVFPDRFQHAIYHGMAVDDMIIQLFDKARSYAKENQGAYKDYVDSMALWNANLQNY